jgi:uncharacterized membrane protein
MTMLRFAAWLCSALLLGLAAGPAQADLLLCSRMSYVVEAAIGIAAKGSEATRGWFRIDPGQCRTVVQGALEADKLYLHVEALAAYGTSPVLQAGHIDLCIAHGEFIIARARNCSRAGQRLARFAEVKPSDSERGPTVYLAEEAEYTDEQARLAGIQRLLVLAGYDANPIDGIQGAKTEAAIAQFNKDRKLAADAVNSAAIFDLLLDAAQRPDGVGFAWCNETSYTVMAVLGMEAKGSVLTRGWYRVEPGRCTRPEVAGRPRRLFSYAEAVDGSGNVIVKRGKPLAWGGDAVLCTRNVRFELQDHADCAGKGLSSASFAVIDGNRAGAAVRLREP